MPYDWYHRDVRIDQVDQLGIRETIGNYPAAFDDASKASRVSGSALKIPVTYIDACTVEVYVDSSRVATYQLSKGEAPTTATQTL